MEKNKDKNNMKLEIKARIEKLVEKIEYRTLADIAADHCYISLAALIRDKVDFVIASDLNKGPLETGKANIKECGYEDKIETRLGSGIEPIQYGEVESVIVAGIGGNLMLNLLQQQEDKLKSFKQLILSPHNEELDIKKYIHSIGYSIKDESYVFEKGMRYVIYNCLNEEETLPYTEVDYVLGRNIDESSKDEHYNYLKHSYGKMLKLKAKLDKLENKESMPKYHKTVEHIEIYESYLNEVGKN